MDDADAPHRRPIGSDVDVPDRPFPAIVLRWDATDAATGPAGADAIARAIEAVLRRGARVGVVGTTAFDEVDRALARRIAADARPGLTLATAGEVHGYDASGEPILLARGPDGPEASVSIRRKVARIVARLGAGDPGAVLVIGAPAPPGVAHLGGSHDRLRVLERQAQARGNGPPAPAPPIRPTGDPGSHLVEEGFALVREHEVESCFSVGNGVAGVRGSLGEGTARSAPATWLAGTFTRDDSDPGSLPALAHAPDFTRVVIHADGVPLRVGDESTVAHQRTLDLAQGILWRGWRHEDAAGRLTQLRHARFASVADRRLLAERLEVTPVNWAGTLEVCAEVVVPPGWEAAGPETWRGPVCFAHAAHLRAADGVPWPPTEGPSEPERRHGPNRRGPDDEGPDEEGAAASLAGPPPTGGDRRHPGGAISTVRWQVEASPQTPWNLDRIGLFGAEGADPAHLPDQARHAATELDTALARHVDAWQARMEACDVELDGDEALQRALRFACYHLLCAANPDDEHVSVGARGLTGPAYMGHVFWDTELWLLPFYTLTWPRAARALLMYRYHTLGAARARARAHGYRGALYAWESADTGEDVTPRAVWMPDGRVVPILSGEIEHHVSAAVAWAAWHHWQATGDDRFLLDAGAEILVETARFWASRGGLEGDGRFHIRGVIGPDEYHENVDDNAYTNAMAQWNLERGVELARLLARRWPGEWLTLTTRLGLGPDEARGWEAAAAAMYTGLDPRTGIYEQFAGYFALEPIDLAAMEPHGAPMDVVLGHDRIGRTQVIKQADVVLMLDLLWDRIPPAVREINFRYYEPRSSHGSSLSPSVHAVVAARLGDLALATKYFRQTAEIDLSNRMGNAAGGVHIAALGGLWQAAVFGFGGLRFGAGGPRLEPRLPPFARRLAFPFEWRQERFYAEITRDGATVRRRPP